MSDLERAARAVYDANQATLEALGRDRLPEWDDLLPHTRAGWLDTAELGRAGYEAYAAAVGGVNVRGEQLPEWDDLGDTVRTAWIAAASAVVLRVRDS